MAEAWETAITLGWALLAWAVVLGAALAIVLLAAAVLGALAVRGVWRGVAAVWRALDGSVAAVRAWHAWQDHPDRHQTPTRPLWAAA